MAEVVSKSNMFTPCIHDHHRVSLFPNNWNKQTGSGLKLKPLSFRSSSSLNSDFYGRRIVVKESEGIPMRGNPKASNAQMSLLVGEEAEKWWEKGIQPNMKGITSAQDLVDSLINAGDKLVVVDFFSPGCRGCKVLHPKICQLAEMNPEVQLLQVNYEEHKSMCYSLNVRVLPFFHFYRGAHGRLCSFSCTNATIKKFKDALAKHSPDSCSLGPPKGLEEKELVALTANKDLCLPVPAHEEEIKSSPSLPVPAQEEELASSSSSHSSNSEPPLPHPLPSTSVEKNTLDIKGVRKSNQTKQQNQAKSNRRSLPLPLTSTTTSEEKKSKKSWFTRSVRKPNQTKQPNQTKSSRSSLGGFVHSCFGCGC